MNTVTIGRVVLAKRPHHRVWWREKGLVGMPLRHPHEVRSEEEYFDNIRDVKVTKDMLRLTRA